MRVGSLEMGSQNRSPQLCVLLWEPIERCPYFMNKENEITKENSRVRTYLERVHPILLHKAMLLDSEVPFTCDSTMHRILRHELRQKVSETQVFLHVKSMTPNLFIESQLRYWVASKWLWDERNQFCKTLTGSHPVRDSSLPLSGFPVLGLLALVPLSWWPDNLGWVRARGWKVVSLPLFY